MIQTEECVRSTEIFVDIRSRIHLVEKGKQNFR